MQGNSIKEEILSPLGEPFSSEGFKMYFLKDKNEIRIVDNSNYFKFWGLAFVIAGISVSGYLFYTMTVSDKLTGYTIILTPFVIFSLVGLGYYKRSKKNNETIFKLSNRTIQLSSKSTIHFNHVLEYYITKIPTASVLSQIGSYQLNLKLLNHDELLLLTDTFDFNVICIAEYLQEQTGIPFNPVITYG